MFTRNPLASFAVTAIAAAGLAVGALIGAGSAAADVNDYRFLEAIDEAGIAYDTGDDAIYDGKFVCQRLDEGADADTVLAEYEAASPELTTRQAKDFILAAADAYCPEYL